jgi:hypothetical protein
MTPGHHLHMKSLAAKMGISMTAVRSHLRSLELKFPPTRSTESEAKISDLDGLFGQFEQPIETLAVDLPDLL